MFVLKVIRCYKKIFHQLLGAILTISLLTNMMLVATPQYNIYDPAVIHTVYGTDKYYKAREKSELAVHIVPFYQHTSTASQQLGANQSNGSSVKVPLGNRLGRWNMAALYYNPAGPIPSNSALGLAKTQIIAAEAGMSMTPDQSITKSNGQNFNLSGAPANSSVPASVNLSEESTAGTIATTAVKYDRLGLRGQTSFDFAFGLGLTVKGGVVDYRQSPTFTAAGSTTSTGAAGSTPTTTTFSPITAAGQMVQAQLNTQSQREAIASQFGLNLNEQRATTLEDTHVDLHWSLPFKRYENEDFVYSLVPFFSIGAWIPTGSETDQNKAFSVPTGNEGFPGGTIEFSLNFDFPKMMQIGFGGGAALFATRTLTDQRVPTSPLQVGIIPWKTTITKRPGATWYFNASLKSEQFESGFSFYADYIFTQHIKDSIDLQESNTDLLAQFAKGVDSMINNSSWKAQNFNVGLKYDITSACSISLAAQGYISGARTIRNTTVLGAFSVSL